MGIEIELHSARPKRLDQEPTGASLLHDSCRHGNGPARVLDELPIKRSWQLWQIDPYGDALFDGRDAAAALREIDELLRHRTDEEQRDAVVDLERMLGACVATPGSRLWFIGD
ncbi:hypothetical protein [Kitasatospora phosalacinea]|uniref:hypothetical protein n=1 Tax=Kitasatospora phosalacinea TaxID=2065 RepID=UPI000524794D|nr:hypothetical protein [Kitasatospora phosalacinea]